MRWLMSLALLAAGCGSSPTGPTPPPVPSTIQVSGTITDTVSGATIGSFVQSVNTLPALIPVSVAGYLTRQARVTSASPTVDLIPEAAPFDLGFYRQLVRNGYEAPGALEAVRVLTVAPSIYLQTAGLSASTVAALENAARTAVYEFSGHTMNVAAFESGAELRPNANAWITIELIHDPAEPCGRGALGAPVGHVWLNLGRAECTRPLQDTLAHEIGHSMGFWHVGIDGALMQNPRPLAHDGQLSPLERYHAAIAYHRSSGNRDLDQDSLTSTFSTARVVVD